MMASEAKPPPSTAVGRLDELARTDVVVAPLARLQIVAQRAAADPAWGNGVPEMGGGRLQDGLPLLHRHTLSVEANRLRRLAAQLGAVAGEGSADGAAAERQALKAGALDRPALLEASICMDRLRIEQLADEAGVDPDLLATLGQLMAMPLLRACGRAAAPAWGRQQDLSWDAGYCPVCAAWPVLAERRGLERRRFLRCGRCGTEWFYGLQKCPYCANNDFQTLGYLAPEAEREARQAATCDACSSYLKTVTTVGALPAGELDVQDLTTLELDVAALERGYSRPDIPGFPLEVHVVLSTASPEGLRSWLPWNR